MTDGFTPNIQAQQRVIRVFVSSTFRDMLAERDHLVKFIFPQLRKLCESRGVTWGEVDLRWGITEEESERGEIVRYCLEEIDRCRPYFIGLLGDYYGTPARRVAPDLKPKEGWPEDSLERSVTELEIIHGVLANPQMSDHAFFYFRDPAYARSLPEEQRRAFANPDPAAAGKLAALKERIRQQHRDGKLRAPPRDNYRNPEVLGRAIRRDFTRLVNTLFPEGEKPDPLDREAADHEAFAESRARVYIGRREYFDRLDAQVASHGSPLVVLGESGIGKSALLANWFLEYRNDHPDDFVLIHFIGAMPDSSNAIRLLRRILLEMKRRFPNQLPDDVPEQPEKIREGFPQWLARVAGVGRIILILDGLNQLEDRDEAPDLGWLPMMFPSNFCVILSTLLGRALDATRRRQWSEMTIEKLDVKERLKLLWRFLRQHRKRLKKESRRRVAAAPQTANPLFLCAMLDELRQFGEHERLDERIEHYLAADDLKVLYELILERWEQDYSAGQDLVRQSLSLICAARRGLSEAELLDLLGKYWEPMPRALWTPFYLAAGANLAQRSGLLSFSHGYVRAAVTTRYLSEKDNDAAAHARVADYFANRPLLLGPPSRNPDLMYSPLYCGDKVKDHVDKLTPRPYNYRKIAEQPWQDAITGNERHLFEILSDLFFFQAIWDSEQYEAGNYWRTLKAHGERTMLQAYDGVIRSPDRFSLRLLWAVGILLSENGFPAEAIPIQQCIVERSEEVRFVHILAVSNLSQSLSRLSEHDRAIDLLKKVHEGMTEGGVAFALAPLVLELGRILYEKGDFAEALRYLREASVLCRTGMDWEPELLGRILMYRGLAHAHIGELDAAIRLTRQSVAEFRRGKSRSGLAQSLETTGSVLRMIREWADARAAFKDALSVYESLRDERAADNVREELRELEEKLQQQSN